MSRAERCRNPWNGRCRNTDIEAFIVSKGSRLPICRRCWAKIADSCVEWGVDEPKRSKRILRGLSECTL